MEELEKVEDKYQIISGLVGEWLPSHGDWFTTEDVWRHITGQGIILTVDGKRNVTKYLSEEIKKGTVRKRGKRYRYIDPDIVRYSNPWEADKEDIIKLKFPVSHFGDEYSEFGFDELFNIHKGDGIVVGGESNEGKTTLVTNIVADNMDDMDVRFVSTEMTDAKLRQRIDRMDWVEPLNGAGKPKFEFGFMEGDDYEDAIHPDKINIIDWIGLRGEFWQIENIIRDMKSRLRDGIVIIVLQKKQGEDNPLGGEFAYRRADVCLSISRGVLKVLKAKDYNQPNPNYKKWAFEIANKGSCFCNIREVEDCPQCRGKKYWGGIKCKRCYGKGFIEK
ncbi:hypothetical protein LCGC14_1368210 [marine sediment metagenome]|uniref:Uncharacterized protein n=1 Tax=marine sediment metagenome TaxID=412755 RepID=A0A0F9ML76_9ZZZZ